MLNKSNYQTSILEQAIESLTQSQIGKRTQIDEFDVRHELDKLRAENSVCVGWKVNPEDPSKNDPIFKSAADLWQYSESHIQTVLAKVKENYFKDLTRFQFPTKEVGKKELIEIVDTLKNTAFMIRSDHVKNFVLSILESVEYVQTMNPQDHQKINILFSPVKGGGKSTFLEKLKKGAEEAGVMTAWGALPSRGDTNDDFHPFMENSLVIAQDAQEQSYYEPGVMAIGRKENIQIKEKYGKPYTARMIADVWTSTNNFLREDRTKNVIECNSYNLTDPELRNKLRNKLRNSGELSLRNIWSYKISKISKISKLKLFLSNKDNINICCPRNLETLVSSVRDSAYLSEFLQSIHHAPIDPSSCTIAKLTSYAELPKTDLKKVRSRLSRILKDLKTKGLTSSNNSGTFEYEKWNISQIWDLTPEEVFVSDAENVTIDQEFDNTQNAYQEIIDWIENNLDDDPNPSNDLEDTNHSEEIEGEDIMNLEEAVEEILDKGREMEYAEREDLTPNYNVQVKVKHKNNKKFLKATFTDLKTSEVKSKCYFTYEPDTVTLNRGQCAEFANDMKQIWYSKGKDIESDEAWTKFAERMMKVVQGKEELHCKAYLYLKVDPKNSHFVKEIWLPEDWKQLR